jgi:hypothetical protein
MTKIAQQVGHTAGIIVKAAQGLTGGTASEARPAEEGEATPPRRTSPKKRSKKKTAPKTPENRGAKRRSVSVKKTKRRTGRSS